MYFELDKNDISYDINNDLLYRIVATEDFKTIDPNSLSMMRNIITVKAGDKGGYVGSEFCLEEGFEKEVKPWVFFCAEISVGSILSGASVLGGTSKVYNESVIEGGNVIIDTVVNNSVISNKKYIKKNSKMLISSFINGKSEIVNSEIKSENVRIESSFINGCIISENYGNIKLINSDLRKIRTKYNIEVKDTLLTGNTVMADIEQNTVYKSGSKIFGMPKKMMVKVDKKFYTHEAAWKMIYESALDLRGIYRHVDYKPIKARKE